MLGIYIITGQKNVQTYFIMKLHDIFLFGFTKPTEEAAYIKIDVQYRE